jgi:hypothetical protein
MTQAFRQAEPRWAATACALVVVPAAAHAFELVVHWSRATPELALSNAWHDQSGGIQTFYRALLDGAASAGRRVVLVVPGERDSSEDHGPDGCIHRVAARRAPAFDRRYRILGPPSRVTPRPGAPTSATGGRLAGRGVRSRHAAATPSSLSVCIPVAVP